jgi:acetylornithine deacetylase/succinyl-diaminopimelate desuccinylase-like protein
VDDVVRFAAELIRIDTTNRGGGDGRERPAAEYVAARLAEAGLKPVLLESAPGRANVVARIEGRQPGNALLLHGHLDVVPAEPSDWTVHPFSGEIRDDVLWGRGAVDMKGAVAVLLASAAKLNQPDHDIVLAFTADEEDTAEFGALFLVEKHADLFEGCTVAVGESGGFTFYAGGKRLYPVASAERGTAWLRLTAHGHAGHGAKPNPDNAIAHLAAAITRIADYEWPVRLIPTVRAAIDAIAAATGEDGMASALVKATIRNSANPTMLNAGYKVNVIPAEATAFVDGRVLPGYQDEFAATMDELTGPHVEWEYAHREIQLEAPPFPEAMRQAIEAEDPGAVVVPYCMSGGTDAKQFARLGMDCYGFTPLVLPADFDYYAMFHGTDERVPVAALKAAERIVLGFLERFA